MPTCVGVPWLHLRNTVLASVKNVCTWLWPSSDRRAGRLPFSTVNVSVEPFVDSSSPA